jgi:hypothetical protein
VPPSSDSKVDGINASLNPREFDEHLTDREVFRLELKEL